MARIPLRLGALVAALMFAGGTVLVGISLTQPDPATEAANASACATPHPAADSYCWIDEPATVADTGRDAVVVEVGNHANGGSKSEPVGWLTLVIPPATQAGTPISFALADLDSLGVHKGDKVTARAVQGSIVSVAGAHGRYLVMGASSEVYPLVFPAVFFLAFGFVAAGFSRDRRLTGLRRTYARAADRILVPLTGVAIIVFYVHRRPVTLWAVLLTSGVAAAGYLAGTRFTLTRPTARTRTAPRPRP